MNDIYLELLSGGGLVAHSKERDAHAYVGNRGETYDSIEDLAERVRKSLNRAKWIPNAYD